MHAMGVKLCPAPTHFTRTPAVAASCTIAISSASLVGRRIDVGAQVWFPAQFVHAVRSFMLTQPTLVTRLLRPTPTLRAMVKFKQSGGGLSSNLEDRRSLGGKGVAAGGGVVGVIIVVLISLLGGGGGGSGSPDLTDIFSQINTGGRAPGTAPSTQPTSPSWRRCRRRSTTSRPSGPPTPGSARATRTRSSCCSREA